MVKDSTKPLAYSYVRMSTDIQLRGDSLRRQQEFSRKYAAENGLTLVEDFKLHDIGVSAFKGANIASGSLGRFLQLVKTNVIPKGSYLLVESLDRISRQEIMESITVFLDIIKSGINIVTLADNHLYPAGKAEFTELIYSVMVLSRAYEESKTKSVRLSAAWSNKRKNLETRKLTKVAPAWLALSADRQSFKIVATRDTVVQRVFSEANSGFGAFSIARRLNKDGVPTFGTSRGWQESYVSKMLANRAVIGEFQPHRYEEGLRVPYGDPIPGYFPSVVDEELFLRVQSARRRRQVEGAGRKGPEYRNLFTNIAKCEYCGGSMRFLYKGSGPKGGTYLKCSNAVSGARCETTGWRYADFEASFLYFVKEVDLTATLQAANQISEKTALTEKLLSASEKLRGLEIKRERVFDLISVSGSPTDFIAGKLQECQAEIANQEADIADLKHELSGLAGVSNVSPAELRGLIDAVQNLSDETLFATRAAVADRLRSIIVSLTVAVEGNRPKFQKAVALLEASNIDITERNQILSHIEQTNIDGNRYNRTFNVVLADGISRRVILKNDNPTDFDVQVHIDRKGTATVSGENENMVFGRVFDEDFEGQSTAD
ncbi:MAG TPA: recombinase family protein [Pseudaminobacter sp.]|nr:recombinase family protein [Pseudaminobacter sp.]